MKALILAGGKDTLLSHFNGIIGGGNSLIIAGKTLLDWSVDFLIEAGVDSILVIVNEQDYSPLYEHFKGFKSDIGFIVQQGSGIGDAILSSKAAVNSGERFMLIYGDSFTPDNIFKYLIDTDRGTGYYAVVSHVENSENYGNVYLNLNAEITRLKEKPSKSEGLSNYVLAGAFIVPYDIFGQLEKNNADMEKTLNFVISIGAMQGVIWDKEWVSMEFPWDILRANRSIMSRWDASSIHGSVSINGVDISGPVFVEKSADIMPGAILHGPLYIGKKAFIGHNALVRPYSMIGSKVVIGQGAEIKNSSIFNDSKIGRNSFVGDSVIGCNVTVGAGCITINNLDGDPVSVKVGNKLHHPTLEKLGSFVGNNAVIGTANVMAPGTIIRSGQKINHNISVR